MILLLSVLLVPLVLVRSNASGQLSVTVFTDKQTYVPGELVTITGQVLDTSMQGVPFASVSIQANDPADNPIHVALVISAAGGEYSDEFAAPNGPANGAIAVYVTASKAGYGTASAQIACTIIPEFPPVLTPWIMLALTLVISIVASRRNLAPLRNGKSKSGLKTSSVSNSVSHVMTTIVMYMHP